MADDIMEVLSLMAEGAGRADATSRARYHKAFEMFLRLGRKMGVSDDEIKNIIVRSSQEKGYEVDKIEWVYDESGTQLLVEYRTRLVFNV